jgi:hypothetical protein
MCQKFYQVASIWFRLNFTKIDAFLLHVASLIISPLPCMSMSFSEIRREYHKRIMRSFVEDWSSHQLGGHFVFPKLANSPMSHKRQPLVC